MDRGTAAGEPANREPLRNRPLPFLPPTCGGAAAALGGSPDERQAVPAVRGIEGEGPERGPGVAGAVECRPVEMADLAEVGAAQAGAMAVTFQLHHPLRVG